jgi:adenosylcobinamide-GDP ribazoletransferase
MKSLRLALGFLTVLPVRFTAEYRPGDLGRAAGWFPWVGLLAGAAAGGVFWLAGLVFMPALSAALALAAWSVMTGGLHLDGLADCCDGLLHASPPERRLQIMQDPRLGAFGAAGLFLHLLLKWAALWSLPTATALPSILLAAAAGRWLILLGGRQPPARPGGMGADFSQGLQWKSYLLAVFPLLVLGVWLGWRGMLALAAAHLLGWAVLALARHRLGGVTGDVFGLLVESSELAVLLACAAVVG